jgi:transposase-like protein
MAKGKYEEWLTEDGLILIEGWARDGLTDEQIAHNMGINVATLYKWKNTYSEINESLKKTKEVVDSQVENALFKKACEGDTTAMIFWLKNRRPNDWRDKRETQLSGNVQSVPDRLVFVCAEDDGDG